MAIAVKWRHAQLREPYILTECVTMIEQKAERYSDCVGKTDGNREVSLRIRDQ